MAPEIALTYTGSGTNGPIGYGWSLQGASAIARCQGIQAVDGVVRSVVNGGHDKLCLDGQRLIQINAAGTPLTGPQTGDSLGLASGFREYRTEQDAYMRIRAYGRAGGADSNGPAYFRVWTKSGQILEYGNNGNSTANAAIAAEGTPVVKAWAVSRISDLRGNHIDFQYGQWPVAWGSGPAGSPTTGREWHLVEVRYAGAPGQQSNKIVFNYDERTATPIAGQAYDRSESYVAGAKNVSVRRLGSIQTFVNASAVPTKVKTFKLIYENGPNSNRSRLKQVVECAGAAETACLPPTVFEYAPGHDLSYQASAAFKSSSMATLTMHSTPSEPVKRGIIPADFDGDGKTDIIRWSDNPAENQLHFSNGDGTFRLASAFNLADQNFYRSDGCYSARVADFNGDGLPDVFRHRKDSVTVGGSTTPCPAGATEIFLGNGDGSFTRKAVTGVIPHQLRSVVTYVYLQNGEPTDESGWTHGWTYYLLDVNADGLLDIVTAELPFQPAVLQQPENPCASVVCTRVFTGNGQGHFVELATNVANKPLYSPPQGDYALGQPSNIEDIDGDGVSDILDAGRFGLNPPIRSWRSRGDGNFDEAPSGSACGRPIDFNGDGRADCLWASHGTSNLYVANGAGGMQVVGHNLPSGLIEQTGQFPNLTSIADVVVHDLDGDGRGDIVRWHDDASRNTAYLSNGEGTFRAATTFNLTSANHKLQTGDGTTGFVIGDFTGRGHAEILRLKASPQPGDATGNQLYLKATPAPAADLLVAVVSPMGSRSDFTWVALGNSASGALGVRYQGDRGGADAATYPNSDVVSPVYVVATSTTDSGTGSDRLTTEYGYKGLKATHDGRGSLGFREVRRQAPGANGEPLTTTARHLQTHPYTGVTALSETRYGALNATGVPLLSRTENIYCDTTAASGGEASATSSAPCSTSSKIQRPYLRQSKETTFDLVGAALPEVTTTSAVNATGDPTQVVVVTAGAVAGINQTFTRTTSNEYFADDTSGDNWILGRLRRQSVRNQVPNGIASFTTSAGNAPDATATAGSVPNQSGTLSNIAFGNVQVGTSLTRSATLTSNGPAALNLVVPGAGSVTGGDFTFASTTCGSSLAVGSSCTVSVTFMPTDDVARSGSIAINSGAGSVTGILSGVGTGAGSVASVLSNAAFGSNAYGTAIAQQSVVVKNVGDAAMTLSVSGYSSPFSLVSNGCGASTAPSGTCSITFAMANDVIGAASQAITLSGATAGPISATVSGSVTASRATLTSGDLGFAAAYGAATQSKTLSFRNDGNVAMTLTGLSGLSTPFSVTSNTCANVAPNASCSMTVAMPTSTIGNWSQLATTSGATFNASLTASGTVSGAIATLTSATALNIGTVPAGAPAPQQAWTFRNDGNVAMSLALAPLNSPFALAGNACTNVAVGTSCSIAASMATGTIGSHSQGGIQVSGAAQGNRSDLSVAGTVTPSTTTLVGSPTALAYGTVLKQKYKDQTLTVTNTGSIAATGIAFAFAYTSGTDAQGWYIRPPNVAGGTCPGAIGSIPANTSCTVIIRYVSDCTGGSRNGSVTMSGSNFTAFSTSLTAATSSTGSCSQMLTTPQQPEEQ